MSNGRETYVASQHRESFIFRTERRTVKVHPANQPLSITFFALEEKVFVQFPLSNIGRYAYFLCLNMHTFLNSLDFILNLKTSFACSYPEYPQLLGLCGKVDVCGGEDQHLQQLPVLLSRPITT